MERLTIGTAKVWWFFDFGELNPQGKDILADMVEWLQEQYGFEKYPKSVTDIDPTTKGLEFKIGRYQVSEEVFITVELGVYSDGVIANSWSSTKETEAFLRDVYTKAAEEFHLKFTPEIIQSKSYLSEVTFYSKKSLGSINPQTTDIAKKLASFGGRECELSGIQFWFDPTMLPARAPFRIERKLNTKFSDNRYYSIAPLQTHEHVSVLEDIEKLLD